MGNLIGRQSATGEITATATTKQ